MMIITNVTIRNALEKIVQKLKDTVGDNLLEVSFFGSRKKGTFRPDSDLDVYILLKNDTFLIRGKIAEILTDVERDDFDYDISINSTIQSATIREKNIHIGSLFIQGLDQEKEILYEQTAERLCSL
jgi:predicted nucleotidyltransferase